MNTLDAEDNNLIRTLDLTRIYHIGAREVPALRGVNFTLGKGQVAALRGRSG